MTQEDKERIRTLVEDLLDIKNEMWRCWEIIENETARAGGLEEVRQKKIEELKKKLGKSFQVPFEIDSAIYQIKQDEHHELGLDDLYKISVTKIN